MTYIAFPCDDPADDLHTYQTDTTEQIDAAKAAMRAFGIGSLPVYVAPYANMDEAEALGFVDAYTNGQVLFA